MARSTGPVLLVGGIVLANNVILNGKSPDLKIAIGTGVAAGAFALLERISEPLAVGLAWTALVAVLFTRMDPAVPSPAESFNTWWERG